MEALERVSRLFVRGDGAIRVSYSAEDLSLAVNGPGDERRRFRFGDEETAGEFLKLYEHFLSGDGWVLQAFVERRASGKGKVDSARETVERRRP